jgi:vacuolar-type H+-ATPase subunit H
MSAQTDQPQEELLESLLSPEEKDATATAAPPPDDNEDVDVLIDELEALFAEAKRVPFGKKLLVDEAEAMTLVDRLRTALPAEVRQAQRILDEQDRILDGAREQARRTLEERGISAQIEGERERVLANAEQEAERIRADADVYVRGVLTDLADRIAKIQTSVNNGIDALKPPAGE